MGRSILSAEEFDIDKIGGQRQPEQAEQVRNDIDDETGGLEAVGIELEASFTIASEAGEDQQDTADDRDDAKPRANARGGGSATLKVKELAESNGEAADGESEDDGGDAGADPGKKCTLVGEMIAGAIGIVGRGHVGQARYYSTRWRRSAAEAKGRGTCAAENRCTGMRSDVPQEFPLR